MKKYIYIFIKRKPFDEVYLYINKKDKNNEIYWYMNKKKNIWQNILTHYKKKKKIW